MIESIRLGTAGYYRMRGLLHPALNDQMPDNEILLAPATVVRKAIANYFDKWDIQYKKSEFVIGKLSLIELEKLMEIITIAVVLLDSSANQSIWLKGVRKKLDNRSLEDLVLSRDFDLSLDYARSILL